MPSGKKTTWSVIWWLRLVVWGQSFFKNIQQIRTIGSTKKQLFGCYNSLKTSVFRGWVLANKTNEKHVVGGLRKSTHECWKKKQTKNVASVPLEDASLHVPEEVMGLISANFKKISKWNLTLYLQNYHACQVLCEYVCGTPLTLTINESMSLAIKPYQTGGTPEKSMETETA